MSVAFIWQIVIGPDHDLRMPRQLSWRDMFTIVAWSSNWNLNCSKVHFHETLIITTSCKNLRTQYPDKESIIYVYVCPELETLEYSSIVLNISLISVLQRISEHL